MVTDLIKHNIQGTSRSWIQNMKRGSQSQALARNIRGMQAPRRSLAMQVARTQMDFAKFNMRIAGAGLSAANGLSKAVLGANLGQIGFAAGVIAAAGYGVMSALGISGQQAASAAQQFHQTMKQSSKPVYGYSELGQSTQGLVFGLNSRRTR